MSEELKPYIKRARWIYILQMLALVLPLTYFIAGYLSYLYLPDSEKTWLHSHYRWQFRTFWISILLVLLGIIMFFGDFGWYILILTLLWIIYRVWIGFHYFKRSQVIPHWPLREEFKRKKK